ncbi:TonB-dependent receptor [Pseudotamlana carrageenivorans]|uniref:TonB-dependent receptor n=1 Tax=Pseudotamlana carrageenivorans TaxID=2069432 RepID=A0A2I7SI94_9FLAO|nr:TonB-dependent receptor [Tamlana carrageenivorans]AUS05599.1 TonB-dependent receptor [Tamlana carrageenivorans]
MMKKQYALLLTIMCFSFWGFAQNGNIQGKVIDENGLSVPYSNVIIESLSKGNLSDEDGKFTIIDVPAGQHALKITYIGYTTAETMVDVMAGQTAELVIVIRPTSVALEGVLITGYNSGQAKALNAQKNKANITNIVSTDQIGKFPDSNIGDAVKRIPGITMQVDQGEARNIIVRGLAPQLNSVTLNGSRIPSAEGDNRNVQMDLIPADMIQLIEVSKAVTPDMDADALGGSVNLVTRTSPEGFRLSATAGSGVNFISEKRILNGSFLLGDRSKNDKFGWMLSASINDNDFGSHDVEAEWSDEFEYFNGSDVEEVDVDPYVNVYEQRNYIVQRVRRSFSANFDYDFDANNSIYLKTIYNWRDDRENRYVLEHEILDAEDIEIGDFDITNNIPTRFPVEVKRETKGGIDNNRNKNTRLEDQRMQNYNLGGNHLVGKLKVDWMGSYAKASEERLNERYAVFQSEYIINNDISNSRYPLFTATKPSDANDLSAFEYDEITEENQYTEEQDINTFLNFEWPLDLFGQGEGTIKFGGRGRFKNKNRNNDFFEIDLEAQYPTLADVPTQDLTDRNYLVGSKYKAGSYASKAWLGSLNLMGGDPVPDEYLRENFDVKEDVYAAYLMANQKLTRNLSVILGVRLESTNLTATGNEIEDEDTFIREVTRKSSYSNVLPGLHFKFNASEATVLRFAWTNTLARPNYVDIVPTVDIVHSDSEIFIGNPDLDPTTSMNFDIMAEHYFKSVGIISGGAFYKNIKKFIYTSQYETEDDSFGNGTTGYDVYQPLNGDKASVFGMEFSFQRQLDFLPGFAKNFSVYANYTHVASDAEGIKNEDGEERSDLDLPNTAPNIFNGSLGYSDKTFSARLSANFSDAYIDEIGGNAFEDRYYDQQFFLDFNAGFNITDNLSVYADLNNITNQPLRYFQGHKDRTMQAEFYGRRFTCGIKYDLFKRKK